MKSEIKGLYSEITFADYPDYVVIEMYDLCTTLVQYCVLYKPDRVVSARTNFFAEFSHKLNEKDLKECILLPGMHTIKEYFKL